MMFEGDKIGVSLVKEEHGSQFSSRQGWTATVLGWLSRRSMRRALDPGSPHRRESRSPFFILPKISLCGTLAAEKGEEALPGCSGVAGAASYSEWYLTRMALNYGSAITPCAHRRRRCSSD